MTKRSRKAIIIGAGIAGPISAILLRRAGFEAQVYEAWPYSTGVGGGLQIAPNGMHVLSEMGLADELVRRGSQFISGVVRARNVLYRQHDLDRGSDHLCARRKPSTPVQLMSNRGVCRFYLSLGEPEERQAGMRVASFLARTPIVIVRLLEVPP